MKKYQREANELAVTLRIAGSDFLKSAEWRALRKFTVSVYGRKCMKCGCTPKDPTKTNVDHIKPRRRYPELALEFSNLQILCNRCNKQKGNKVADYRPRPLLAIAEQVAHQSIGEL